MHLSKRSWKLLWFSLGIYGWMTLKSIRWGIGSSHFYFQRNYLGGRKLELCGKATGWMLDCWFMFRKIKIHLLIRKQILFYYESKYIFVWLPKNTYFPNIFRCRLNRGIWTNNNHQIFYVRHLVLLNSLFLVMSVM